MPNCVMCGASIPEGQRVCSMCYGDIDYGSDGYYRRWAEQDYYRQGNQEGECDEIP
ncbi:MAG: hypothetical protein PHQ43_14820 [Dehalococcoidales bacterium]|nr:hypothetical protein [Dehalococcoidales bacterium]